FFKIVYGFSDLIIADEGDKAYQILLRIPGKSLNDLNYREFSATDVINLMVSAFYAITDLHKKNIAHRDIKPDNVLFDEKVNAVCYIDFGLSEPFVNDGTQDEDYKAYIGLISTILLKYLISHIDSA